MFSRLGIWCHDHRKLVVGVWIAVLLLGNGLASAVGDAFRDEFVGDAARDVVVEATAPDGGFVVRKPAPAEEKTGSQEMSTEAVAMAYLLRGVHF